MKQIFLFLIISIYTNGASAQKCGLVIKKDNFSDSREIESKPAKLAGGNDISEWLKPDMISKSKDTWVLNLLFFAKDTLIMIRLRHGSSLCDESYRRVNTVQFKFEDGSTIEKTVQVPRPLKTIMYGDLYASLFAITKEELAHFATQKISLARIETDCWDHKVIEKGFKEKIVEQIQFNASCMLNELNSK